MKSRSLELKITKSFHHGHRAVLNQIEQTSIVHGIELNCMDRWMGPIKIHS